MEKVLGSLSRAWQLFMRSTPPVLPSQSSQILGLSNEVKHISELQVAFEKIAKNLTKFSSKNFVVRKFNFLSVHMRKNSVIFCRQLKCKYLITVKGFIT